MKKEFAAAMERATAALRSSDPMEATRIIGAALGIGGAAGPKMAGAGRMPEFRAEPESAAPPTVKFEAPTRSPIDPEAEVIEPLGGEPGGSEPGTVSFETAEKGAGLSESLGETLNAALGGLSFARVRKPLRDVVRGLREGRMATGLNLGSLPGLGGGGAAPEVIDGARFEERAFSCAAGSRGYKVYVPASGAPKALVVMLHGCKQNPDDFAVGTGMNAVAEREGLVVVYPRQEAGDNMTSCWNWFRPGDQRRDQGEPAILAGITREVAAEFGIGPDRIFAAGLSAGGAMAAVLGEAYPDLFAAVGIHSGLPVGAAQDVLSAFAAMRGETGGRVSREGRVILFHGDADHTVNLANAERIFAGRSGPETRESGRAAAGRSYQRRVIRDAEGRAETEFWLLEGAGHAWSGGAAAGSYTDPTGPDAATEMVRFFLNARG